ELYCTSACVLAWRLHDGLASVSQDEILAYMGGTPSSGAPQERVPDGVNNYTNTHDAILDYGAGGAYSDDQGRFLSRQISSVNAGVPVIALANSGLHAVVIDGGSWHTDSANGNHVWDTIQYMDPSFGFGAWLPGDLIGSLCPYDYVPCRQVIGSDASFSGNGNFDQYSGETEARGMAGGGGGGCSCPPQY
ncbi:MAG TPA: hypothetical protein VGQ46_18065, partial [Thermoanaerobaculia bacterium]|nr:hypothetical protein [Thermoanaerobaculia bacterium]